MDPQSLPVNRKRSISVTRLLDRMSAELELQLIGGYQGVGRPVLTPDVNRPGLALSGYVDYFANDRVQILGNTEIHYMERLDVSVLQNRLENMFSFEIPAFVLSRHLMPRNIFLDLSNTRGVPVVRSRRSTDELISQIILFLADEFAPGTTLHGTALDCYGVGVVISGPPGIGKSETALELVERGHRLVADDVVSLKRRGENTLFAETNPVIEHHMEIRGVGIIDIRSVFGVGHVLNSMPVGILVELEEWREDADYDRTGLADSTIDILGVQVPHLLVPVRPGRNISTIVEVAALNHRLKELGTDPAGAFNERLWNIMKARKS